MKIDNILARLPFYGRLTETARLMYKIECAIFVALWIVGSAVSVFVYPFERPAQFAFGLLIGCAASIAKVVLLDKSLSGAVHLGGKAKNYAALHAVLRNFGTIAILIPVFFLREHIGVVGAVAGLLSLQVAAFVASASVNKGMKTKNETGGTHNVEESAAGGGDKKSETDEDA